MANPLETTFKNLQCDERYKKLERSLKVALLKNTERKSVDNRNTGSWANVSSINGDHLDISSTAMSIQSSRIGSEVVSSSTNLRNILLHKQHFNGPRNTVATSSENQFPTNKDNDDSAMMPPPRTPSISNSRIKRSSEENQRMPLLNMPINSGRNNIGFSVSTPASSISSIPKCTESMNIDSSSAFQENNDYHERNVFGDAVIGNTQKHERNFSRWRVLLNDKGQLIIKGTLECGKVARSKPVIRRLAPTSVQSIFKHTYHLQGNLVDDRDELPDYVRGKFYNGFPDDWENVYQVWRNFVNDGNRLSFRWPTPVTDSDDDIKSGITEITYRPERLKKTVSPRKRKRLTKTSKLDISVEDTENHPEPNSCSYSHISSGAPLEKSIRDNYPQPEKMSQSHSNTNSLKNPCKTSEAIDNTEKSFECNVASSNVTDKSTSGNSLAGYIQEDKLNIIVDNLTNKNCSIEYINKVVEMFECMKYVVSYQSSIENESVKGTSVTQEKKESQTPMKKDRSMEEKYNVGNKFSSKSGVSTVHSTISKADQYDNQLPLGSTGSGTNEKSYKDHGCQTRTQFMDYESSESDNDCYEDTRGTSTKRFSTANENHRKTQKYKNAISSIAYKANREYVVPEKSPKQSRRQYAESLNPRKQRHDSSVNDEEFAMEKKREPKLGSNRTIASPRKIGGVGKENRREAELYDSSISITEDEERNTNNPKAKDSRTETYDSSVSITEDEHGDQNARNRIKHRKYYPEPKANLLDSKMHGNGNSCDDRKRLGDLNYYPESKSRSLEQVVIRTENNRGARKRLDSLDYCPESNSRQADQGNIRSGDIRDTRKRLNSMDYYSDAQSPQVEQGTSRDEDVRDTRKRLNSMDYYSNAQSRPVQQNINRNRDIPGSKKHEQGEQGMSDGTPLRNSNIPQKVPMFTRSIAADRSDCETSNMLNPSPKDHDNKISTTLSNVNVTKEHEEDSAYSSRENNGRIEQTPENKRSKNLNEICEAAEVKSCKSGVENHSKKQEFQWSPESPEISPPKSKTPQVRKKPIVTKVEAVDIHLNAREWQQLSGEEETEQNAGKLPRSYVDGPKGNSHIVTRSNSVTLKSHVNTSEPTNTAEPTKVKTRSKEANGALKVQNSKASTRESKTANGESPKDNADNAPVGIYGSKDNPKLLTAWVPTVICDTDGDKKCHLVFEGKLLNEAGHVADRKFVTDSVRRRLSPKLIETFSHDFYKLVGDLNDTKHVVPKELIKVCHSGCPSKIAHFCERWKSLAGEMCSSPPQKRAHNTSVDCLSVPMSSRGRRILPPLNYWAGERVVIKDNKTLYSPGNSQESSIPSSLENTTLEVRNKKNSPKARTETKKTNELRATEKKITDLEKVSPGGVKKSSPDNPSQQTRATQKPRSGKRRLTRNVQVSSSESDDDADTKPTPRKRKTRASDKILNTDTASTRKLRNSTKNSASPQRLEENSISPQKNPFKKPLDPEVKGKLRKRQTIDDNQRTLQQFVTRRPTDIKCTYYKNVPMHDGDLSEDQLSTL